MRNHSVCIMLVLALLLAFPLAAQNSNRINIVAELNLAIQNEPSFESEVIGILQRGKTAIALGRNEDGTWLQVAEGWVIAKNVLTEEDIFSLSVTTLSVLITSTSSQTLKSGPDESFDSAGTLSRGVSTIAIGRNDLGTWLEIDEGWILATAGEVKGDVMLLPETFPAFTILTLQDAPIYSAPFRTSVVQDIFVAGEDVIAIGRNLEGTAVQTPRGWLFVNYTFTLGGDVVELPVVPYFFAHIRLESRLYKLPNLNYELNTVVPDGEQVIVIGRNSKGDWMEIPGGWVQAGPAVRLSDEVMSLPLTGYSNGISVKNIGSAPAVLRSAPGSRSQRLGEMESGRETMAIGTTREELWLLVAGGWVENGRRLEVQGALIELPIVDATGEVIETSSERKLATPTPVPTPTPTPHPRTVVEYTITEKNEPYDLPGWCRVAHSVQRGQDYQFSVAFYNGTDKWYTVDVYDSRGQKLPISRTHLAGTGNSRAEYQRYDGTRFSDGNLYARIREIDSRKTIQIGFKLDEAGHHYLQIVC